MCTAFSEQYRGREGRHGEVNRPVKGGGIGEAEEKGQKLNPRVRSLDCQIYKSRTVS